MELFNLSGLQILLTAILVSTSCSLIGVFLVLRKMAMIVDAITHTILFGIVIAFFIVPDLNSPILILGASSTGVLTVYLIDSLNKIKLIKEDSAIGIIFPFLFSIGIILISKFIGNVHLDIDSVLLGEIIYVPFEQSNIFGFNIPTGIINTGTILIINILFFSFLYKEWKLLSFDPILTASLGFMPVLLNYVFITLTSITVISSFEAVGAILIVSFMIGPVVCSYLLTNRLNIMIIISIVIGIISSILGYIVAMLINVSVGGMIATVIGFIFFIILIFAPEKGILINIYKEKNQYFKFSQNVLLVHLYNHKHINVEIETSLKTIDKHLNFDNKFLKKLIKQSLSDNLIYVENGILKLTDKGIAYLEYLSY